MRGRLNLFQRTMLRWRAMYPYSAVHVVRIDAPFDAGALVATIGAQLDAWGLTGLTLDSPRLRYEYRGGPAAPELVVPATLGDPETTLGAEIERQINLPFADGPAFAPFRFFAVPVAGGFHLGIAYDHFVAGGDAIAGLLAAIVARHAGNPGSAPGPSLYPPTYRSLFARNPWLLLRGFAQLPGSFATARNAQRSRCANAPDKYNGYAHFRLSVAQTAALRATVTASGASFNDLLIAVLMRAVSPAAAGHPPTGHRRQVAISSIVNIRREFGATAQSAFGQFLAVLRVAHPSPEDVPAIELAGVVHRSTAEIKRRRLYLRAIVALGVAEACWPFLADRHRRRFFAKHNPALGGVTILGVDALWAGARGAPLRDYLRAVSTGPATPVVLAASVAAGALSVGVSYRRAAHGPELAAAIENELRACAGASPC